ncbi:hypothetical protein HJC23_007716 [Cyclotella cryptica]|uniref:KOW domain-containing protein n=1 Tax=Cyclotella cryptica TaxID=29204 RepID=A0ABD3P9K0_9STRA|eukprot:CCRYP_016381-RA/>CCRYP_016381-RA protein AED:0.37 eAED:0.37 QI:157/1/1/1/1/1/2/351/345
MNRYHYSMPLTVTCFLIATILFASHSTAFQLACRRSFALSEHRGIEGRFSTRIRSSDDTHGANDAPNNTDIIISRRRVFQRSLYSLGLALAASSSTSERGNTLELGIPNLLLTVDGENRGVKGMPSPTKKTSGLGYKIRSVSKVMDELQRDLMQERWDLVETYPNIFRSYVPILTAYTDSAFPTDIPTDQGLRVALRYEVGRFFASLERLKQATNRRSLDEAYVAYSDMSLHFDRYLRIGGLYTYYDDTISLEPYYEGVSESSLVYVDPKKDPALVRDLIVLREGPDKGRTGIVIGIYPDGSNTCAVKLDRFKGIREIRVVPRTWAAKRLGEQDPDDVFLIPRSS